MTNNLYVKNSKAAWRPSTSFWVTVGIWLLLLIVLVPTAGFSAWLVTFILFLIVTALYALIFGRRSWLGLPSRKGAGGAVGGGVVALVAASMILGPTAPQAGTGATLAELQQPASAASTSSAKLTPSPTAVRTSARTAKPTPTAASTSAVAATPSSPERLILLAACMEPGASQQQGSETLVCTLDDAGVLVWMSEKESKDLLRTRTQAKLAAEAEQAAAQKAADDAAWAAAQQAEAERVVAEQAAAQKAADDAAWVAAQQAEAERVVAEQAAQQAPPIQQFVEAPASAYYPNCAAARAAGAAPLHLGQPGYRGALDRDKDGVACE